MDETKIQILYLQGKGSMPSLYRIVILQYIKDSIEKNGKV